jgi:hypothetical protein
MSPTWIVLLLAGLAQPAPGTSPQWIGEPIATRQVAFTIPYQIERPQQISQEPVEVQLHVSSDRGVNWRLSSKVDPAQGSFYFRAPNDGEYWFTVLTVDRSGQVRPPLAQAPILRVVVDSNPPGLQLKAQRGQAGQITAQWEVRDERPKLDSLRLHYRVGDVDAWQPVAVGPQNFKANGALQTGEVTWWPNAAKGIVQIRVECTDLAGNPAVSHAQVNVDAPAAPPASAVAKAEPAKPAPAAPVAQAKPEPPKTEPAKPAPSKPAVADAGKPPAVAAQPNPPVANQVASPASGTPPKTDVRPAATAPSAPPVAQTAPGMAPAGPRPRMINARMFELEYDASGIGAPGVGRVELWATRDGGRSWGNYMVDDDNRSPLIVRADAEGLYGFRLVRTNHGRGDQPPRSGDPPQVWIGVDLTPPAVRILRIQPVAGQPGQMLIAWEASDSLLAQRPISVSCATTPYGPWLPIAGGLENTGQYVWFVGANAPEQAFIRVEARDEAGNTSSNQTPGPLLLRPGLPTAQLPQQPAPGPGAARPGYR